MLLRVALILLVVVLLVRAAWRLLAGVVEGATTHGTPGRSRPPERGTRMVRDPVCGTFVVQSRALSADHRGEVAWFCSEKCRRTWQAQKG